MNSFMKQMTMYGIVNCSCGGNLISNSGKVICNFEKGILYCWKCRKKYNMNKCYKLRRENKAIKIIKILWFYFGIEQNNW